MSLQGHRTRSFFSLPLWIIITPLISLGVIALLTALFPKNAFPGVGFRYVSFITIIYFYFLEIAADTSTIFRAYLNPIIFNHYKKMLIIFPALAFFGSIASTEFATFLIILNSFFFIYHIGMQNFGIFRIFERKRGFSKTSRFTTISVISVNFILLIAGQALVTHKVGAVHSVLAAKEMFPEFLSVPVEIYFKVGYALLPFCKYFIAIAVVIFGFLLFRLFTNKTSGEAVAFQGAYFGFWILAFLFLNPFQTVIAHQSFHAIQTLLISSWVEGANLQKKSETVFSRKHRYIGLFVVAVLPLLVLGGLQAYYYWIMDHNPYELQFQYPFSLVMAVNQAFLLTHFVSDSFIWRQRREFQQI